MQHQAAITEQRVIIVGGGNVGLSFALLLADKGIRSTLLEKRAIPPSVRMMMSGANSLIVVILPYRDVRYRFMTVSGYGKIYKAMRVGLMKC